MGIATTVWRQTDGNAEYANVSPDNIVDPTDSSIDIVDPSSVFLISTDVTATLTPDTIWIENEGI